MSSSIELGIANPIPGAALPPGSGSVAASVGIPTTCPSRSTSAPPLLPGLIGALVWITFGSTTPLGSPTARPRALTIPSVTELRRPSGFPIAIPMSPTRKSPEANVAVRSDAPSTRATAMSSGTKEPTSVARYEFPRELETTNVPPPATTWALVTMSPLLSNTTPDPSPCGVEIWTTAGATRWITSTKLC